MPGLFDKIKSGAEKASQEAERLVRVQQAQSALNAVKRELDTQVAGLGQKVLSLYDAGALVQPELVAACQEIDAQRAKVAAQEAEVERIREERPAPSAPPPSAAAAAAQPVAPPRPVAAPQPVAPPQPVAGRTCHNCGAAIPEGVRFCPECGTAVQAPAPAVTTCPSCHAEIKPGVAFCPECGARQPV